MNELSARIHTDVGMVGWIAGAVVAGMGVEIMPESDAEKIQRVRLMADSKQEKWDLSPNDIAALQHVLGLLDQQNGVREALQRALDMKQHGAGNEFWDEWEVSAVAALMPCLPEVKLHPVIGLEEK